MAHHERQSVKTQPRRRPWLRRLGKLTVAAALWEAEHAQVLAPLALASVVAHYVHFALLWRPALSVVFACHKFAQLPHPTAPWDSVREELRLMRLLLGFCVCYLR